MSEKVAVKQDTAPAEKPKKDKAAKRSRALTIVGIVLCVILVPILVINVTLVIKGLTNPDEVPSLFGYSPLIVKSGSMEPTIKTGDLIIIKPIDIDDIHGDSEFGAKDGTIISFYDPESRGNAVTTHRCIEVIVNKDGTKSFRTKGDGNFESVDQTLVPEKNVIGTYVLRIPAAGNVAFFMQTTPGLIICIAVPIALFVGYDLIMKKRYDKKKKKETDSLLAELEALRAQAAGNAAAKPAEQAAPADEKVEEVAEQAAAPVEEKIAEAVAEAPADKVDEAVKAADTVKESDADSSMAAVDALINEITSEDQDS